MSAVKTTVIGSYPVDFDNLEFFKKYTNDESISWDKYIDSAVQDMINAGIDIVSDGQTRDPFVNIFLRKLNGCRIRNRPEVIDKIEYTKPITVEDQKHVKKIIPKNHGVVGLIAGPYTLTKSSVDLFYNDEKNLAFDFAKALNHEALNLQKHVDLISVDEPFYSVEMPDYAKELTKTVLKNVNITTRLHICGDVSKIIPNILELPVDILSHEFKAKPQLFEHFKKYDTSKKICLGSVRSDDTRIESIDEIVKHLHKGNDIFDGNIVQISPDCGLRMLPRNIAFEKLKNLVKACRKVYG
jgi:5-methyltetrahydropteroyltriglutamate--homocysteine methyltransferase